MKEVDGDSMWNEDGLSIRVAALNDRASTPFRQHHDDAGADLFASEDAIIPVHGWTPVRTGIAIEIPYGYVGLVHPRSGLAFKHGISVLNTPGTVDAGYRGEVMVVLYNVSTKPYQVLYGDRIAQLLVQKVELPQFYTVKSLDDTLRGDGGFGSTGT